MKNSPIEMLYREFRDTIDTKKNNKEYFRLLHDAARYSEYLIKTLPKKQRKQFINYENCCVGIEAEEGRHCFREGFLMGIRLAAEVFLSTEDK